MTYIEGWDPGGQTGYALGFFTDDKPFTVVRATTLSPLQVWMLIAEWQYNTTEVVRVAEDFRLRASNPFTADLQGDQLIGVMKFAEWRGWADIHWQMPADKAHVKDNVLKDSGLWRTGREVSSNTGRHVNDAIIHVLKYLKVDLKHEPTIRKYWG